MRRAIALIMVTLAPAAAWAQGNLQTTGTISTAVQQVENNTNSSKFGEYRDLRDGRVPLAFKIDAFHPSGFFIAATGSNVTRRDQSLGLSLGKPAVWRFSASWDELPHTLSNKAVTPYVSSLPGKLEVPATMQITFKKLATAGADAANVVRMDTIAATYAQTYSKPTDLQNLTKTGSVGINFRGIRALDLSAGYTRRSKTGEKLSYGPIGDRPPRSLNIQLAEPLDYGTGDFTAAAEYVKQRYQVRAEYLLSQFTNDIDVLEWENVWASAPAGAAYDTWDRAVATFGRRPLAPDNTYRAATISAGVSLPFESRLTGSYAHGTMEQDETLVPYAYQNDLLVNKTLPRASAEAKMNTTNINAEYFIAPLPLLNVRAFFRRFDLENETPSAQWQYVTQDASNLNGTVSYVNKRVTEPLAWARDNIGAETTLRLRPLNSNLAVGFEREVIDREHRQAEHSTENIVRASLNARPTSWLALRTRFLRGTRDAGEYNWRAPSETYWYAPTEATDNNDPKASFEDHPDMRKFDLADRKRDQWSVTATLTPTSSFSFSTGIRYRKDDFDTDVGPVKPLENLTVADKDALTPGDQLGLLASESRQLTFDASYAPTERLGLNASYGFDVGESSMRSMEFNENNKKNPSAINTAVLGPWTRKGSQWTADFEEKTSYATLGGSYDILPKKISLVANYTMSLSDMDITYGGFGSVNFDGTALPATHEFSFVTPETVKNKLHMADVSLQFPLLRDVSAQVGWTFESYTIRDWQQSTGTAQFETVGSDLFLRDTSRSHQWGNRFFNMGSYLAPGFTGHAIYFGLNYNFGSGRSTM